MDRDELTLIIAGALAAAVLLGWIIGAIGARLGSGGGARDLAARLAQSEEARRSAEARLAEIETDLAARLRETEAERASAEDALARERAAAEAIRAAYRTTTGSDPAA
ncbi:hypothetical protein [Amaricoccus sp.]|uniref:hypothetical protein n=1 Tax=Amaricoccus sp. TaxID=1872485 RepID=UPI001B76D150|nr:hypothetical protein [Amaricoccus sp.]MBP7000783.1 hypothetical protein [Amaricoccus sp.]